MLEGIDRALGRGDGVAPARALDLAYGLTHAPHRLHRDALPRPVVAG